jgi:hypothetical protein
MEPSVAERVIVKERKSEGEVVKPARPVCQEHSDMIDLNEEISSLWRRRGLWLRRWGHPDEEEQARVKAQLGRIERRLVRLGERIDRPRAPDVDDEDPPGAAA